MRIAYLSSQFPFYSQTFVLNEVEAHHRQGLDVLTLSCSRISRQDELSDLGRVWQRRTMTPGSAANRLRALIAETVRDTAAARTNSLWLGRLMFVDGVEFVKGGRELFTAAALAQACRERGVQLIHVHFASRSLSAGLMLSRLLKIPVSCSVHAFDLWGRSRRNLRYRLKECAFIAAESQYHVDYVQRKCGDEIARRCHVIHNGVDLSRFDDRDRKPVPGRIVMTSRMAEKKGHRYLVEACRMLRDRNVPFECVLIGDGPESKHVRAQIERLQLGDVCKLTGALANDQLSPFLNSAAVFVLPAIVATNGDQDGSPTALIEAMACGIPVISSPVAGIPELLREGQAGYLVPAKDTPALANAIEQLLTKTDLAAQLGSAGRRVVEQEFDICRTTQKLRRLFAEAITAS